MPILIIYRCRHDVDTSAIKHNHVGRWGTAVTKSWESSNQLCCLKNLAFSQVISSSWQPTYANRQASQSKVLADIEITLLPLPLQFDFLELLNKNGANALHLAAAQTCVRTCEKSPSPIFLLLNCRRIALVGHRHFHVHSACSCLESSTF